MFIIPSQFLTPHKFRVRSHPSLAIEDFQSGGESLIMKASQPERIQFISASYPGNTLPAEVQRRAQSHAARTAHAKARRLRMIAYQAGRTRQIPEDSQVDKAQGSTPRGCVLPTFDAIEIEKPVLPSPVSLLASDWRDPFDSFARSFQPIEHFLLDHCESLCCFCDYYYQEILLLLIYSADEYYTIWLTCLDVRAVLPYMNITCNRLRDPETYLDLMTREWVRLTLTHVGSLNGVFLASCRHLLQCQQPYQQPYYTQLATRYKLLCVQALREAISSETSSLISDSTVSINILLAYDEVRKKPRMF